jgi:hypothetical protein
MGPIPLCRVTTQPTAHFVFIPNTHTKLGYFNSDGYNEQGKREGIKIIHEENSHEVDVIH